MVGVSLYLQASGHLVLPDDIRVRAERFSGGLVQDRVQHDRFHARRLRCRLAIVERFCGQRDRTFEGTLKARRCLLDAGVFGAGQHIGDQLRRGERIAQVMIDLGDGRAASGAPQGSEA